LGDAVPFRLILQGETVIPEWGLFNDGGLVADGYLSREAAEFARAVDFHPNLELHVEEICPHHAEQSADYCELCDDESESE
jgi:hypothetical protein